MYALMVAAACTFGSGVALVPVQRLALDEQWLVNPEKISVPEFRLRALRPVSVDGRPLLFSCSAATDEPANISWDVSAGSSVVSVAWRTGLFGAVVVVDSLLSIKAPMSVRNASVACRITRPDGRHVALKACSSADPNSRCVNGTCKCAEGLQSVGLAPCRRWASYGDRCDRAVAGCTGLGVVCGRDSVCTCARGRVRLNDSCVLYSEPENDRVTLLTPRQRVALISSVLITLTGVVLAMASLCGSLRQRCCEGTSTEKDASFKIPEWAEPNSYYMSTRFWVSEQPYFAMAHREARRPPKKYFSW
ncbi:hypothetical protein HPB52_011239 [Rhipicephalus sanguineus]|uniref:Ig-like domain-containing protein n=1 Tax=Rhipicephalus sanguineus TaxID=34632 RepID=A0A9D4PRJ2_RHISA|nr:hypothetical protein HPB52_011239 [Rhipicephalus sanguineus]